MSKSRREFLTQTSLGLLAVATAYRSYAQQSTDLPPGAPPAFGVGPAVGPEVSTSTFAEAEKLVQFELNASERTMAANSWRKTMASLYERRTGPRKLALESTLAPAMRWDPVLPNLLGKTGPKRDQFVRSKIDPGPLPASDEEIAFAPLTRLSRWIEERKLSSDRLTRIYIKRIERFDPKLHCVI
ncbi:MAG: amidase, partial [Candidatus Sulfotelmatobacter sp.]